jgi:serine/threonine-protein kinase
VRLTPGSRLGRFEVVDLVGEGGMGEVYRARDSRLGREVALKVLPERLQGDDEFRLRLGREAESISQLQHPNICALYDIGHEEGVDFLVMELLEGETLEQRLHRERLSVDEALQVGTSVAGALERAHRHGIVHRDLKPGNVMLTPDGPKVLDFGLAKELTVEEPAADTGSPTVLMTGESMIVGTLHYMAPEQLEGKQVDARTDIFALGCMLHEMLTGRRPFEGESQASLIAAILEREPPTLENLEVDGPPGLSRVVERCLAKDPERRWQSSGDVQALLADLATGEFPAGSGASALAEADAPRAIGGRSVAVAAALALGLLAAGWLGGRLTVPKPVAGAPPVERHVVGGIGMEKIDSLSNAVLSRDGETLAFIGNSGAGLQIHLRRLDEIEVRAVDGSQNAGWATFSPDGEWLLFFDVVERGLKKISVYGGTASFVVERSYLPASWETDGYVYYTLATVTSQGTPETKGLWRIPAAGGEPEPITRAAPRPGTARHFGHYAPQLLPGGRRLLFSVGDGYLHSDWDTAVLDLDTGDWQTVLEGANQAKFVGGHLVFWRDEWLWAAPFDLERLEVLATPRPVLDGVARHPLAPVEVGQYRVTSEGDLVYLGGAATEVLARVVVAPFDGGEMPLYSTRDERVYGPTLLADRRRVGFQRCVNYNVARPTECQIWTVDRVDGTLERITDAGVFAIAPLWEASGEALVYTQLVREDPGGTERLMRQPLDGTPATVLLEAPSGDAVIASASLADGRVVFGYGRFPETEIRLLSADGSVEVLVEPGRQMATDLSPDERWLVFHSDRSGQFELYLIDLAAERPRPRQITTEGVRFGHFAPDGRSLFMRSRTYPGPAEILRAPFDPSTGQLGEPESVRQTAAQGFTSGWWMLGLFEVTDDGLILAQLHNPPSVNQIVLVRNWASEIADLLD